MNRIVLIGNGFDLAHRLKTSYGHFLDNYWKEWIERLKTCMELEIQDEFYEFIGKYSQYRFYAIKDILAHWGKTIDSYNSLNEHIKSLREYYGESLSCSCKSHLFEKINIAYLEKWVDIENEYYRLLKQIYNGENTPYKNPKELNEHLKHIENKLIAYLSKIQEENIKPSLVNPEIQQKILEPFKVQDISVEGEKAFIQFIGKRLNDAQKDEDEDEIKHLLYEYGHPILPELSDIRNYLSQVGAQIYDEVGYHIKQIKSKSKVVPSYFLLPDNVLFLNFNYTKTASLYVSKDSDIRINHIHGELNNPDNPIIFGYGDEMDEDYKRIVNLNDNKYLENIKSICYLKTDNYRKLLQFIDSAPYQVTIMGHSCGNSDRTLLNTLFEHKNCLSIKPYYHKKEDGTDNYIDIIQNISRDFNDMTLMRDRVVNKTYCEQLPQNKPI